MVAKWGLPANWISFLVYWNFSPLHDIYNLIVYADLMGVQILIWKIRFAIQVLIDVLTIAKILT